MKNRTILPHVFAIFAVPLGIFLVLAPCSLLLGWNILTLLLFWFILVPVLAFYLPMLFLKKGIHIIPSPTGLALFYGLMIFMIYEHYQSDYFNIMITSSVVNTIGITIVGLSKKFLNKTA